MGWEFTECIPGGLVQVFTMGSEVLVAAASNPKSEVNPGLDLRDPRRRGAIPGRRTRAGDKQEPPLGHLCPPQGLCPGPHQRLGPHV